MTSTANSHLTDEGKQETSHVQESEAWKNLLNEWDLGQYIDSFANEGFDHVDDWPSITAADLTRMGLKTGHQRRFLRLLSLRSQPNKILSKTLVIFGAAYGLKDVTNVVRGKLPHSAQQLDITASNSVFGDPWEGIEKSLVVVYGVLHNTELHGIGVKVVKENQCLRIHIDDAVQQKYCNSNGQINVLGACYGLKACTAKMQGLVQQKKLVVTASNNVFGDSWYGIEKSLVAVYCVGKLNSQNLTSGVRTCVVAESQKMSIVH
mmetsp:Transcript_56181/g.93624  ORF Transcript_56181/g.93624 Transcript_56181/m.93624 type:complete len:263 (+) Transcript_56181:56-844(+)